jgi:hypothetical protein
MGCAVVIDANISDTAIYVMRSSDLVLWEGQPPKLRTLTDTTKANNLTVTLQAINFIAFGVRYARSVVKIGGLAAVEW